ncbi:SPFH domain-containing protein [Bacteroidales bacterium OttesenSCG-928-I21]|nr:SPFH domain-containing protein [Bacteroidales bacterium OttesenSCG-928-I21]
MKTKEEKFSNLKLNGILMLILNILFLGAIIWFFIWIIQNNLEEFTTLVGILIGVDVFLLIVNCFFWNGLTMIEPNEARVIILFGKYVGTLKDNGFFWINPFYTKKKLTLRARNLDADPIKVNDKMGNPIMIGHIIVWRVKDTYKASFDIDNGSTSQNTVGTKLPDNVNSKMKSYENFVKVQGDAALRSVAGMYAYDNLENKGEEITLRSGGEEVNNILEAQLNERLAIAGIEVLEARVNYLAYAPEIAAVMLRRQQADAIISAREKIVDGAVGMVKMAIDKLSEENVIELDDDKKAAMVTNLMVVLCSDEPAQPIVNSGTLHH